MRTFERGQINHLTVGRNRHAIAPAGIRFLPNDLFAREIKTGQRSGRADVEAFGGCVGANALDVQRLAAFTESRRRNAFHEAMAVINVEDQHAVPAIFEIIANAWFGHIEQPAFSRPASGGGARKIAQGECAQPRTKADQKCGAGFPGPTRSIHSRTSVSQPELQFKPDVQTQERGRLVRVLGTAPDSRGRGVQCH